MARKKPHEDHVNHEAWAIPYGDLVTLLLAFFVVMYAISSVNEGKYRAVAASLASAFNAPPSTLDPIQIGDNQKMEASIGKPTPVPRGARQGPSSQPMLDSPLRPILESKLRADRIGDSGADAASIAASRNQLAGLALQLEDTLSEMVKARLITVRRSDLWLEVEINSDLLFASGSATLEFRARELLGRLAVVLRDLPNPIRIEGYTDDRPIATAQFPSNWELSAARAASVVHLFVSERFAPERLVMVGYGEYRPKADNTSDAGRNANRRVVLMVLATQDTATAPRAASAPAPASPPPAPAYPAAPVPQPAVADSSTVPPPISSPPPQGDS
ncbi:flagellar motor protein MotD [Luteimonas terrae]|uniref:Chemotaxis protein MotB n=1 Tax=Luteimonas terrae TaxID=1530191 RepID=A0ABU1XUU5_9GAMM|nr:flagellar motor protein MotD [Luteimonas terrae]MDR7192537.1 chemotaxis protein MotB [Luteimonas terrae]